MKARDIMTAEVISVGRDTSIRQVAKLLGERRVSAVPVVDANGGPIGMISEGDLIGRDDEDREARRDWWLTLLAEGGELNPEFLAALRPPAQTAGDVMATPVVTATEDTEVHEIAKLLLAHRIKRVPVTRDGRVVGIVSRADLVRAFADELPAAHAPTHSGSLLAEALAGIDHQFSRLLHRHAVALPAGGPAAVPVDDTRPSASDFRRRVSDHERAEIAARSGAEHQLAERRRERIADLVDHHVCDDGWRALLRSAQQAADAGDKQFMLLRFPSGLCNDAGRAINSARPEWPETLRGEAAEIYARWHHDLRPYGFALSASVLAFPEGMPGDIGLFLVWGS